MQELLKNPVFRTCGIAPESLELLKWIDSREDDEGDAQAIATLEHLTEDQRASETWENGWLRIWTDGGVDIPTDYRLTEGGCGIFLGKGHPLNTAAAVTGTLLNSYRAELQAVRLLLTGIQDWKEKIWITLDNKAVVQDLIRVIQGNDTPKDDNVDIWPSVKKCLRQRASTQSIQVTWCRGHTSEDDVIAGLITKADRDGNHGADELATKGVLLNNNHSRLIRVARQRKTVTVLQQAMQRDIWRHRHARIEVDKIEAAAFEAEAAEIEALEK